MRSNLSILLLIFLLLSCQSDDNNGSPNQQNPITGSYYFPPLTGDSWETVRLLNFLNWAGMNVN